jgi:hypothetical protein
MNRFVLLAAAVLVGVVVLPSLRASGGTGRRLPNPCRLLASAHPETAFGEKEPLIVSRGRSSRDYSGVPTVGCVEAVGRYHLWLRVSTAARGVQPVGVIRLSRKLSGLGPSARIERVSFDGASSHWIVFHRGVAPFRKISTYVAVSLVGARTAALETLARRLYHLLYVGLRERS